jgi:transcriptional regulator with XRE-family HTH domain/quercetin dioxygenase-like cupin family protein
MNGLEHPNVGEQIREIREARRHSLRALADRSGLSLNAISRIELGKSSPTVATLQRLATALSVPISEFFMPRKEYGTLLVRKNQRLRTGGEGVLIESLGSGLHGQMMEPFLMTLLPGAICGNAPISHAGEELCYCLEGEVEYLVNEEWHRLEAGDSLLFQSPQPHMCRNTSLNEAIVVLIILAIEEYVRVAQHQHLLPNGS